MTLWLRRIGFGLLAVIVAQQIYAHALGALYGSRCSAPDQHWWGTFWICTANAQRLDDRCTGEPPVHQALIRSGEADPWVTMDSRAAHPCNGKRS